MIFDEGTEMKKKACNDLKKCKVLRVKNPQGTKEQCTKCHGIFAVAEEKTSKTKKKDHLADPA